MEMLGNIFANGEVIAGMISSAGPKGDTGETGYTPQKGIDYFTEQDKQELLEDLPPHIDEKIETFNQNAKDKTTEFNQNSIQKIDEYNNNVTNKINDFNQNAENKTTQMINQVIEVEAMVKRPSIQGNSEQKTRNGKNLINIQNYTSTTGAIINTVTSKDIDITSPTGLVNRRETKSYTTTNI